jgi:DNA-binding NarL/FixJ family response regulator
MSKIQAGGAGQTMLGDEAPQSLRIVICAPSAIARAGLERLLQTEPGVEVIRLVTSSKELNGYEADVVLYYADANRTTESEWSKGSEHAPVLLMAEDASPAFLSHALAAPGVGGLVSADCSGAELVIALKAVAAGLVTISPKFSATLGEILRRGAGKATHSTPYLGQPQGTLEALTSREHEVLAMMMEGLSNKEIALQLNVSTHTVKFHISSILAKLGASSRTEAITIGLRRGLLTI